jgi:uncharacterized damage-inducible protein DinB
MFTLRRSLVYLSLVALASCAIAGAAVRSAHAQAAPTGVKGEALQWFQDAQSKLVELAEATPEGKYAWRPGKDKEVRSTGEVFMHVAAANYGIPGMMGIKPPEGFDFATFEKSKTKKAEIVSTLKASFDYMEKAWSELPEADLDKPTQLFGMNTTLRGGYLLLLSHCHEHLGQSIAYARSNGIVPPWTARQQAAAAAKKSGAKAATNSK